jgi:hypothetical protein
LAVYLASQDNPENELCPRLRLPKDPSSALNSLLFAPKPPRPDKTEQFLRKQGSYSHAAVRKDRNSPDNKERDYPSKFSAKLSANDSSAVLPHSSSLSERDLQASAAKAPPDFTISEQSVSKDYRSFAANVFGTVAFKMLEWLTPNSLQAMSQKVEEMRSAASGAPSLSKASKCTENSSMILVEEPESPTGTGDASGAGQESATDRQQATKSETVKDRLNDKNPSTTKPIAANKSSNTRRNSNARVRAASTSKPKRRMSIEPTSRATGSEDLRSGLISPRLSSIQLEKATRPPKSQTATSRAIPEIPATPSFFDHVTSPHHIRINSVQVVASLETDDMAGDTESPDQESPPSTDLPSASDQIGIAKGDTPVVPDVPQPLIEDKILPQSLSRLSIETIVMFCDILHDDGTSEDSRLDSYPKPKNLPEALRRHREKRQPYPKHLKKQWKIFIEQCLFSVFSDPHALVKTFSKDDTLYDSQTLWYCMLRLTRVAPSLVLDGLWIAAASLFAPPKSLQTLRSPTTRAFRKAEQPLATAEAAYLLTICFHALVAFSPSVTDSMTRNDMSRIRSNGLTLAVSGAVARQPPWLCLQYEDAFSNDLAVRLARRLFSAITARQYFAEMADHDDNLEETADDLDVLQGVLSHMDTLNTDASPILEFHTQDRVAHESRLPTVLLDWARTVLLREWDGNPEVPVDSPFGGALSLIAAMCKHHHHAFSFF